MKTAVTALVAVLALAMSVSAGAGNKNVVLVHFNCEGGITFSARNIAPSNTVSGQIVDYHVNGQVVSDPPQNFVIKSVSPNGFSVPGFEDKDTIDCSIDEYPGRIFTVVLTPRG